MEKEEATTESYEVVWAIAVDATSPEAAARLALEIQRDPDSSALCFLVGKPEYGAEQKSIDLWEGA